MADNGQDEELPRWRHRRPERPPRPPPPLIATSRTERSRSESPTRSDYVPPRRSPPSSVQPRTIQFLIPDNVMPQSHDFWPGKKKTKDKPNETNTEEDTVGPDEPAIRLDSAHKTMERAKLPAYFGEEPNETDTDPKPKPKPERRTVNLFNLVSRKKKPETENQDTLSANRSGRVSGMPGPTSREPAKKVKRFLYTTDEEVRDALVEFGVFIVFLILTSLGKLLRSIDSRYLQSIIL